MSYWKAWVGGWEEEEKAFWMSRWNAWVGGWVIYLGRAAIEEVEDLGLNEA